MDADCYSRNSFAAFFAFFSVKPSLDTTETQRIARKEIIQLFEPFPATRTRDGPLSRTACRHCEPRSGFTRQRGLTRRNATHCGRNAAHRADLRPLISDPPCSLLSALSALACSQPSTNVSLTLQRRRALPLASSTSTIAPQRRTGPAATGKCPGRPSMKRLIIGW